MYKRTLCCILAICGYFSLFAQTDDDNVIITNRIETYVFEESKGTAVVKEKSETYYECTKRGTSIPIMEMYDSQTTLDKVSNKRNATPKYNLYTTDDMFYSDAKVCHFDLSFDRKGSTGEVKFEKTYKDPRYFTSIYLSEPQFVKEKTVTITIPDWMKVELVDRNFGKNVAKEVKVDEKNKTHVYIYKITDEKATKVENNMPGKSHIFPHIMVLSKSATIKGEKITYFETLNDQYAWYNDIVKDVKNDEVIIKAKADEITKSCTTDDEKVKTLFAWVQDNIRYIAFEDGIAAFKPDDAQEVLRKKYGDCKGMSNLLKALLKAKGFDARLAWLGTNHIAYDYSTPSLSADNHMICALFFDGKTYYLDPTVKYMPLGEYPQTIQGRQTLVQDKDKSKYLLNRIPEFTPVLNTDSLYCEYTIDGDVMKGKAGQYYMGESKQVLLSLMDATPKDRLSGALKRFLENGNSQDEASDIQTIGATSQSKQVEMLYNIDNRSGLQQLGAEYYIDLDAGKDFMTNNIDTAKRVNDLEFSYRYHIVKNVVLHIPEGYKVSHIPEKLNIDKDGYTFRISYRQEGNKLFYKKEITIRDIYLRKSNFAEWNSDIAKLRKAYMEQISLTK
ncbi:hypothetical protein M2451_002336 [Dysgonomonas sp. PFB1-18]|uniref:transglutaminase domain-containing protein n=1 Tax=unclassified Dysgonomonas TaxID=2630389 RepID=UPI002477096B|nr:MULTISPECIES: transglutaminase domain-containing protein [unclassified Dysgonomonas]MDH6307102.1 hypothetical protein [Dysgonomonas sp. PF1-14]MDH6337021.1 hypothetical protein [Dysgonomonas sp. PF1-16]MDH6381007.1 hypothetical protein [Dysgonomonas sp. PFB1-18]MDH6396414.1 hypothetical protein [Dysgonomonas sp. PF1-23]